MKIKFNKFERVAGVFVLTAMVGALAAGVGVAIKRGWFESKVAFETTFPSADGIHSGTTVQMAGLRAGAVESVELKSSTEVRVVFLVSKKFEDRVRDDSVVRVIRPFIIGEKVLEVTVGSDQAKVIAEHTVLKSEPSMDIMDLLSGRTLGTYLDSLSKMSENLKYVADAFMDPERIKQVVQIFDELSPLVKNMNAMSSEVVALLRQTNGKKQLAGIVNNLAQLTEDLNKAMPYIRQQAPQMATDFAKISKNTAILTEEMAKLVPMMADVAPELPHASRRAIEALDETVVTLKALQKSFILRGSVEDVREEEAARVPASKGTSKSK